MINQSAKAAEFDTGKPQLGRFQVQDHFKLSNSSKVGSKMNYVSERNLKGPYQKRELEQCMRSQICGIENTFPEE